MNENRRDFALVFEFDVPITENRKDDYGGGDVVSVDKLDFSTECILCKKEMQVNMDYVPGSGISAYRCNDCGANYVGSTIGRRESYADGSRIFHLTALVSFDFEFQKWREEREEAVI